MNHPFTPITAAPADGVHPLAPSATYPCSPVRPDEAALSGGHRQVGGIGAGTVTAVVATRSERRAAPNLSTDICLTADARTVSPRGFLEALGLTSPEMRAARRCQEIERCIRAIEQGAVYGFPPVMVAECRHIMAMRAKVRL